MKLLQRCDMCTKFRSHEKLIKIKQFVLSSADIVSIKLGPEISKEVHCKIAEKKHKPTVNRPRNSKITDITLRKEARTKGERKTK